MKDFCSDPLPALRSIDQNYGKRIDLCAGPIGNAGLLTCVIADRLVEWQSIYRTPKENEYLGALFDLVTPQESMVFDVFLHRDLPLSGLPECNLFDRLGASRGFDPENDADQFLPFSNQVIELGSGLSGCDTSRYPRYSQVLEHVFHRSGIDAAEFQGYRLSIDYPQIPTAADLKWKLPENPKQ